MWVPVWLSYPFELKNKATNLLLGRKRTDPVSYTHSFIVTNVLGLMLARLLRHYLPETNETRVIRYHRKYFIRTRVECPCVRPPSIQYPFSRILFSCVLAKWPVAFRGVKKWDVFLFAFPFDAVFRFSLLSEPIIVKNWLGTGIKW